MSSSRHLNKIKWTDFSFSLEYDRRQELRFVKIIFVDPVFDIVTRDISATFVDKISEIGGTLGLLTGFTIITAVEILYFAAKIVIGFFNINWSNHSNQIDVKPKDKPMIELDSNQKKK